jgi:hypothetical protein
MIQQIDFLTPEECCLIQKEVHVLRPFWTPRYGGLFPIFTLGEASYLDAHSDKKYQKIARKNNALLSGHFKFMYDRLAEILSKHYKLPVVYENDLALPGFHVFLSHKLFETPIAAAHFDLQFKKVDWPYAKVDLEHPVSFTAAIILPTHGGGLYFWDIFYKDHPQSQAKELEKISREMEKKYYAYQAGTLIVHDGLFLHQIAPGSDLQPQDERITLQGHGLICDDALHIYW